MKKNNENKKNKQNSIKESSNFTEKILDLLINHPVISILAGISACFLTIYSFLQPMYQEKIKIIEDKSQLEIKKIKDNYENQIKNIRIVIDKENNEFNITNILSKNPEKIPKNAIPYKKDHFYAIGIPNWKYEKISELKYLKLIDEDRAQKIPDEIKKQMSKKNIHLWYQDKEFNHIYNIAGIQQIFPHIYVQKVEISDLKQIGNIAHIIEMMLINHISLDLKIVSQNSNIKYEILNLQKLEDILFLNSIMTLNDVEVNKKEKYEYEFYIRKKTIFVPVIETNSFYLVEIIVPDTDLRELGNNYILTKEWMLNFRILGK